MYIQTAQGDIPVTQVDSSTKQPAQEDSSDWNKDEEIVLVELEGGDWRAVPVAAIKEDKESLMSNVSWKNSSRAEYYSEAYAKELAEIKSYVSQHLLGGLKFITWEEIEFILNLKWHEDSVQFLLRAGCHPSLNYYIGAGYVNIAAHTDDSCVANRFFNVGYEASPPESLRRYEKFYDVGAFVRYLEVNGQVAEGYVIEASHDPEDLGFVPDLPEKEEYDWRTFTPITWKAIERLPLQERELQLADTYLSDVSSLCYRFKRSEDEAKILLYGTSDSFEIACIRKARAGEPKAAVVLGLCY